MMAGLIGIIVAARRFDRRESKGRRPVSGFDPRHDLPFAGFDAKGIPCLQMLNGLDAFQAHVDRTIRHIHPALTVRGAER